VCSSDLLRMIATLDVPNEGAVRVLGEPVGKGVGSIRARMGVLFQNPSIDPLLTIRENLRTHAALFGIAGRAANERIESCAEEFGVHDRLDDRAGTLSGGLLRRADLARAFLNNPELLILDEPTVGLDPSARLAFIEAIEKRHREQQLTIIMSTHLLDEAARADRVALLAGGRIVGHGTPDELRASLGAPLVLTTDEAHEDVLTQGGNTVTKHAGCARTSVTEESAKTIASQLIARGAPVSVGPPTLDDVYMRLTGTAIGEAGS